MGTSQLYKGTRYPEIQIVAKGRTIHITAYPEPPEDTMGLLAVALGLRPTGVDCQGMPGRYILHRVGPYTKVDRRKALIGCLSWCSWIHRDGTHTMSIRMVWGKCTTSAECKSIRIAVSAVMDGWNGSYLEPMEISSLIKCFSKTEVFHSGYSEGITGVGEMVRGT